MLNILPNKEKQGLPWLYLYWEQSTLLRLSYLPQGIRRESRLCLIKVHLMIADRFVFKGTFSYINEEKLKCARGRSGGVKKWPSDLGLLLNQLEVWLNSDTGQACGGLGRCPRICGPHKSPGDAAVGGPEYRMLSHPLLFLRNKI